MGGLYNFGFKFNVFSLLCLSFSTNFLKHLTSDILGKGPEIYSNWHNYQAAIRAVGGAAGLSLRYTVEVKVTDY